MTYQKHWQITVCSVIHSSKFEISATSSSHYSNQTSNLSADEALIQQNPQNGELRCGRCVTETGCCVTFDIIYTGCHSRENTTISLEEEVVTKLASPYFSQNHHMCFEKLFLTDTKIFFLSPTSETSVATRLILVQQ